MDDTLRNGNLDYVGKYETWNGGRTVHVIREDEDVYANFRKLIRYKLYKEMVDCKCKSLKFFSKEF